MRNDISKKTKLIFVVGARPNFMKAAPLLKYYKSNKELIEKFDIKLVHTGQHYDDEISSSLLSNFEMNEIDYNLDVRSGTHANQTAKIMVEFEKVCEKERPDWIVVFGDVNSTLACSIVGKKMLLKVCHVEAGLRSFDRSMPEEINRIVTDSISDLSFTTCENARNQLMRENISEKNIHFVGNLMIDTLFHYWDKIELNESIEINRNQLRNKEFAVLTLHRPSNVDNKDKFENILKTLKNVSQKIRIYFPCHPRTAKRIQDYSLLSYFDDRFILEKPAEYIDMLQLYKHAKFVITDSGGIQEETTALQIPCLTLRENTERPITVTDGTNTIVGDNSKLIIENVDSILNDSYKTGSVLKFWDGDASKRIWNVFLKVCGAG